MVETGSSSDDLHTYLKTLKSDTTCIKDLHWDWESPKKTELTQNDFIFYAKRIVSSSAKIQNILGIQKLDTQPQAKLKRSRSLRGSFKRSRALAAKNSSKYQSDDVDSVTFHTYLKLLKAEAFEIKKIYKTWKKPEHRDAVDENFRRKAENITFYTDKLEKRLGLLSRSHSFQEDLDSGIPRREPDMDNRNLKRKRNDDRYDSPDQYRGNRTSQSCPVCARLKQEPEYYKRQGNRGTSRDLEDKVIRSEQELKRRDQDIARLYQDIENKNAEIQTLAQKDRKRTENEQYYKDTITQLKNDLAKESKAKEESLRRLSEAAGSRLRVNNPAITDLSDPNRPLKLAEQLSEFYDNEWTNTLEMLMEKKRFSEETGIKTLLKILTDAYTMCVDSSERQLNETLTQAVIPQGYPTTSNYQLQMPSPSVELGKCIKDYRKANWNFAVPMLQQAFFEKLGKSFDPQVADICRAYAEMCIQLCWLMNVQDPPVILKWEYLKGSPFDTSKFRTYTSGGSLIEYVVWPLMQLHKDGPLLCKGIAQGKNINYQKPASRYSSNV